MSKKLSKSKWLTIAALLMFIGAVFQITSEQFVLGILCFAAGVSFSCSAKIYQKKETEGKHEGAEDQ